VHLAIPKPAVFVDQARNPSASVMIELYPGRRLEQGQVVAIQQLVSSSIPEMKSKYVSVVDSKGHLLSPDEENVEFARAARQLDYTKNLEDKMSRRLSDILMPIIGQNNYRVQVSADVDFTMVEQAEERFNPDLPALRSERVSSETLAKGDRVGGVPGALSNTPPGQALAPEKVTDLEGEGVAKADSASNERKQAARNFELDRTISHTRHQVGRLERLTIAVVVDYRKVITGEGETRKVSYEPWPQEELARMTALVKDAVGFSATRGDSVNLTNQAFIRDDSPVVEFEPEPIWKQAEVQEYGRLGLGFIFVLLLVFGFFKPLLGRLAAVGDADNMYDLPDELELAPEPELEEITLTGGPESLLPGPDLSFEAQLNAIKGMVADDPRRVAQVVKSWLQAG